MRMLGGRGGLWEPRLKKSVGFRWWRVFEYFAKKLNFIPGLKKPIKVL